MIDRTARSRIRNYQEQLEALGGTRSWLAFKVQMLRSRRAPTGHEVLAKTPLAEHPVILRSHTSDNSVFSQIFVHREYRCLDHVEDAHLVIDCGANVGYSSAYLMSRFPMCHMVAIEPEAGNFEILRKNVQPYAERCTTIRAGVWSRSIGLVVSEASPGDRGEWAVTVRPVESGERADIEAVDIGTLLEQSGFDRISILKIDIEGSEAEVFAHNIEPWIDKVDHLVIELHSEACREVVESAMAGRGFDMSECEELTMFTLRCEAGPLR